MAKLNKGNIVTGGLITAADLTNVYDALGGTGAVDICVSGSLSAWNGITVSGDIIPFSGSAFNLGSATKPWNSLHLSGSTIYLWSDAGTAETLSRSNIGDLKAGRTLKAGGSGTVVTNQIVRLDGTDDGDDSNRIQILNDRIYIQTNGQYSIDAKNTLGLHKISFGDYTRSDQGSNFAFKGSISSSDSISADNFIGDGSSLTNLPASEWDGTHSGNGLITGTLSADRLVASGGDIKYWDGALGYNTSVSTELNSLRSATGTLWSNIQDNDADVVGLVVVTTSLKTVQDALVTVSGNSIADISDLQSATGSLLSDININGNEISVLKTATGTLKAAQDSLVTSAFWDDKRMGGIESGTAVLKSTQASLSTQIYQNVSLVQALEGATANIAYNDFIFGGVKTFNETISANSISVVAITSCLSATINSINGTYLSGSNNSIDQSNGPSHWSAIAGGINNHIKFPRGFIGAGQDNIVAGSDSVVAGGDTNIVSGAMNSILGGQYNLIESSNYSAILGGRLNVIEAGDQNTFIIGSNLTSSSSNTTYVDQLNVQGNALIGIGAKGVDSLFTATGILLAVQDSLVTATGNLNNAITSNDMDINLLNTSANTAANDVTSLKSATGSLLAVQDSLVTATGNLNTAQDTLESASLTSHHAINLLTMSANTARNDITSLKSATGDILNNGKVFLGITIGGSLSADSLRTFQQGASANNLSAAGTLVAKDLPGTNPGDNGEIWKQPLSACFLGSTSSDMLNALGSASSDLQTVLYGS